MKNTHCSHCLYFFILLMFDGVFFCTYFYVLYVHVCLRRLKISVGNYLRKRKQPQYHITTLSYMLMFFGGLPASMSAKAAYPLVQMDTTLQSCIFLKPFVIHFAPSHFHKSVVFTLLVGCPKFTS